MELITLFLSVVALGVSAWTAWRRHWFDKVKHLELQADFKVEVVHRADGEDLMSAEQADHFVKLTNVGKGDAFHVRLSTPVDPTHILGLSDTAQGPFREGQFMIQRFAISGSQLRVGIHGDDEPLVFVVEWVDLYGEPRRQIVHKGRGSGSRRMTTEEWREDFANQYDRGAIGTTVYQDLRVLPRIRKRRLRKRWEDRH